MAGAWDKSEKGLRRDLVNWVDLVDLVKLGDKESGERKKHNGDPGEPICPYAGCRAYMPWAAS